MMSIVAAALLANLAAAAATGPTPISPAEQRRLATFFAPVLLFHPAERFYPTDALAPLGHLTTPTPEDAAALAIDRRVRAYLSMPLGDRLRFATVYWRVTPLAGHRVAIEYFLYYLFNRYRVRPALFPLSFDVTHPHDFESLVIVVAWQDESGGDARDPARGRIVAIYPRDHGREVPDNVWTAQGEQSAPRPLHVIVELGSHAMAADLDENGRFDPGIDMNRPAKFVWGIRDSGRTWAHFKPGYMETRAPGRGVTLVGPGATGDIDGGQTFAYGLAPASELTDTMTLVERVAGARGFGHASWPIRLFGDVDPRTAVRVPSPPFEPARGTGEAAAAACERGLSVGASNLLSGASFYAGGRWLVAGPARVPDLLVDGAAIVTNDRHFYYTVDALASYRVDFVSRLLAGAGVLGHPGRNGDARTDLLAGVELRFGHLRVRQLARHNHRLGRTWYDLRVGYVF